jgi:hypothetical protein
MIEKIPFQPQEAPTNEVLAGASPVAMNIMSDGLGVIRRRPGIAAYSGAPSTVIDANGLASLYVTTHGNLYAVGAVGPERPIYQVSSGGAIKLGGGVAPFGLTGSLRPVFAETEMLLVIAGGQDLEKLEFSSNVSSRLGGSPPKASHVIAQSNRLLANDVLVDRTAVRFSGTFGGLVDFSGAENWGYGGFGTSGYFTAQTRPDDVAALGQTTSEVYVFGAQTTQLFQPDPNFTFAPVVTQELGMGAPYSLCQADGSSFWLDNRRRIVMSSGRGFQLLSDDIRAQLEAISTVRDCWAFRPTLGSLDALAWRFPTDGTTFVYQKGAGWSQWAGWDSARGNWKDFIVTGHAMRPDASVNVVATSTGRIGMLSMDVNTDLGDPIVAYVETGYLNRNSDAYKLCKAVRLTLRRGATQDPTGPQAKLSFRDRPGAWTDIPVDLGASGDTEIVVPFYSLGTYRRRAWRFEYSGSESLALVSATEEFDVMSV